MLTEITDDIVESLLKTVGGPGNWIASKDSWWRSFDGIECRVYSSGKLRISSTRLDEKPATRNDVLTLKLKSALSIRYDLVKTWSRKDMLIALRKELSQS